MSCGTLLVLLFDMTVRGASVFVLWMVNVRLFGRVKTIGTTCTLSHQLSYIRVDPSNIHTRVWSCYCPLKSSELRCQMERGKCDVLGGDVADYREHSLP